jgi:hypothetical protein
MKKIFLILIIVSLIIPNSAFAQIEEIESKVDLIKDKVASRVAELKLVEKRGVVGIVESATETEIRVNDLNDKTRIIEVDELTKFNSLDSKEFGISDIKKGTKISAIGLYNKESKKLLARFVNEISIPIFLSGVISAKDDKNFTITLSTEDEKEYLVDIENITKSFSYTEGDLETSGFTKLELLQNAIVIGFTDPKDQDRITASRVVVFPDVPKNPRIEVDIDTTPTNKPSGSITPSPSPKDEE